MGSYRPSPHMLEEFGLAIVARCRERGVPETGAFIPKEIVAEIVGEFGLRPDQGRAIVRMLEERAA